MHGTEWRAGSDDELKRFAQGNAMMNRRGRVPQRLVRVFLDTNVLASSIGTRGLCSELLDLRKIGNLPIVSPRQFLYDGSVLSSIRSSAFHSGRFALYGRFLNCAATFSATDGAGMRSFAPPDIAPICV